MMMWLSVVGFKIEVYRNLSKLAVAWTNIVVFAIFSFVANNNIAN
jgi:hypothetical protein